MFKVANLHFNVLVMLSNLSLNGYACYAIHINMACSILHLSTHATNTFLNNLNFDKTQTTLSYEKMINQPVTDCVTRAQKINHKLPMIMKRQKQNLSNQQIKVVISC